MNILIVDDEIYIVEGIAKTINWAGLGITRVLTAFSMGQAQKIFEREEIDLLLADIEMPKGSGFELLEWAQKQGYHPVTLLLTSYAKFEYAQKAIQMQCLGYLVKPADVEKLECELRRAVEIIKKDREQKQYKSLAEYWNSQLKKRTEAFWYDLLRGNIQPEEKSIEKARQQEQLSLEIISKEYFYILVQVELNESAASWEKEILNYAIRNILSEIIYHVVSAPIPDMGENTFMMMCCTDQHSNGDELLSACNEAAQACGKILPGKFTLFMAGPGKTAEASKYYKLLNKLKNEFVTSKSIALSESVLNNASNHAVPKIPIDSWTESLLTHHTQSILNEMRTLLPQNKLFYPRSILSDLYYAILQVIYSSFDKKSIQSNPPLIIDKDPTDTYEATKSSEYLFRWAEFVLKKAENELNSQMAPGYIVEDVRQFVLAHIGDENLNRTRIASEIHLNPDYLSFIFKERYGHSLSSFIATERIKAAKKLLISTNLPITDVSSKIGYTDISYFSKQFKQLTGMAPQQYRKSVMNSPDK